MPLELRTLIRQDGMLELSLAEVPLPQPAAPDEVVVRVEAAPINPSDLALLLSGADLRLAQTARLQGRPAIVAPVPPERLAATAARIGQPLSAGNEGAGTVVAAGSARDAQALLGRRVAVLALPGQGMYAEYRAAAASQCLPLPPGTSAAQGAAAFVNPLTALGMVETARREGHTALALTAAASSLGRMLLRLCQGDGLELVCIVRRPAQAALLRTLGARYAVDSSAPDFAAQLAGTFAATGTRLAFDATGGGSMPGQLIQAMEAALLRQPGRGYDRYGSQVHKQVYIYGYLERGPTTLPPGLGMAWGVGGWLVFSFWRDLPPERRAALQARIAAELTTTFATRYEREWTLAGLLTPEALRACAQMATGGKCLLRLAPD